MDRTIFVQNVKRICKENGVAPTAACVDSGAGRGLISDVRNGKSPSIERMEALAHYLGVTVSDLLGEDSVGRSGDALRVADAYSTAPAAMQEAVRKLLGIAD